MNIKIISDSITTAELREIGKEFYDSMIKGVVDLEKEIVAFGGQYHMDSNLRLIEQGSEQKNVWGFNIDFDQPKESWIEYVSLINIRPLAGNRRMEVEDEDIKENMKKIINSRIK